VRRSYESVDAPGLRRGRGEGIGREGKLGPISAHNERSCVSAIENPVRYQSAVDVQTPFPIGSRSIRRKHWRSRRLGRRANRGKPFCGSADDSETLPVEVQTTQQGGVLGLQYCVAVAEPSRG
jgi:hypothetical protein